MKNKRIGAVVLPGGGGKNKRKKSNQNGPRNCVAPVQSLSGLKRQPTFIERILTKIKVI